MKKLLASFMFFTRLPFWRIISVDSSYFKKVVEYWSITGWLTGAFTAAVMWFAGMAFPVEIAVIIAVMAKLFLTGALHEDGLADFFDGMGGGTSREQILRIMKDSHIGTYGVIALILYYILLIGTLSNFPLPVAVLMVAVADPFSKFCASQLINLLPYARKESEAKNKTVYDKMSAGAFVVSLLFGVVPLLLLNPYFLISCGGPVLVVLSMVLLLKKKIDGYTGDCCGAAYLLSELSFFIISLAIYRLA